MNIREWVGNQSFLTNASNVSNLGQSTNKPAFNEFEKVFDKKRLQNSNQRFSNQELTVPVKKTALSEEPKTTPKEVEAQPGTTKVKKTADTSLGDKSEKVKEALKKELAQKTGLSEEALADLFLLLDLDFENSDDLMLVLNQEALVDQITIIDAKRTEALANTLVEDIPPKPLLVTSHHSEVVPKMENLNEDEITIQTPLISDKPKGVEEHLERFKELVQLNEKADGIVLMKAPKSDGDQKPVIEEPILPEKSKGIKDQVLMESKVTHDKLGQEDKVKQPVGVDLSKSVKILNPETSPRESVAAAYQQMLLRQPNGIMQAQMPPVVTKEAIVTQVIDMIKGHVKVDDLGTSMLVRLKPEHLGDVELKLNVHRGAVLAEIKVENEMVKAAVESQLDDLKQNLSNKGYTISQMSVSVDSGKKEQNPFSESRNGNRQKNPNILKNRMEFLTADEILKQVETIGTSTIDYLG